jgi:hypothetical protein
VEKKGNDTGNLIYINLASNAETGKTVFFPVLAIEEPEAHLHPNAQKQLYSQINSIAGQKIISTHFIEITYLSQFRHCRNIRRMGGNNLLPCNAVDLTIELFLSMKVKRKNRLCLYLPNVILDNLGLKWGLILLGWVVTRVIYPFYGLLNR